ncbi:MAG: alpha-L-fucosidase [Clostridiales bacterium]|nr:alpha-L-fucosidase [Clostridiales bacterium]
MKNEPEYIKKAAEVVPSERQLLWQELEFYAFVHFGINTFTDSEWGSGGESPELFDPKKLNARQWAKIIKAAGMKAMILTCKHHDGFCLWPSEYTEHSVKNSPWKNGKGDVVKEAAEACRAEGLKFGIYLSPWDRHELTYGTEDYNVYFKNQLRELLTKYGDIFCVWLDGACGEGKNGRRQEYDWNGYVSLIRFIQPNAVISICGPDVRWCGNESGVCRRSEWSVVPYYYSQYELLNAREDDKKPPKKIDMMTLDMGGRSVVKKGYRMIWYPAEVDVSLRKGWFYHEREDHELKLLSKLVDIWFNSVGANASLLLNLSPNKDGLVCERDMEALLSLGAQLEIEFGEDLAQDSEMTCSGCLDGGYEASNVLLPDKDKYWHSGTGDEKPWIMIDLGDGYDINKVVLCEHIKTGQQIEGFTLYGEFDGKWKKLSEGTVIGHKRICRFEEVRVRRMKLVIEKTRCFASIESFQAY